MRPHRKMSVKDEISAELIRLAAERPWIKSPNGHGRLDDHVQTSDPPAGSVVVVPLGPLVTYHAQLLEVDMSEFNYQVDTSGLETTMNGGDTLVDQRAPKKLFDAAAEAVPDVTLKDYEDQNLRELARERRRIIDNQVVRRKKIESWAFATSVDETNSENWIETLRHLEEVPSSPTESIEIASQEVNEDMSEADRNKTFAKKPGTVDSASIIENKESLRVFWERRIMAEQERSFKAPLKSATEESAADVSPPDSLNGDLGEVPPPKETSPAPEEANPSEENATPAVQQVEIVTETPESQPIDSPAAAASGDGAEETSLPEETSPVAGTQQEEQQAKEETVQMPEVSEPIVETPQAEEVPKSEAIADKVEAQVEEPPATAPVVEEPAEVIIVDKPQEVEVPITASPPQEQTTPPEPVPETVNGHTPSAEENVANKPQIIGETYHQDTKTQEPPSPAKAPHVTLKKTIPSPMERTFKAESKIALEIQEMQKREEELKKMREVVIVEKTPHIVESTHSEGSSSVHSDDSLGPSPPQSLSKPALQNVSRTLSPDSVPNGHAYNIGYAFTRKENVKVKPFVDPPESDDVQVKAASPKETPIEKEIRIAREREEELRKEKGLSVGNGHEESLVRPTSLSNGRSRQSAVKPPGDTQRSLATSRIQLEIEEQTEREKSLRASGVIKTISQERTDSRVTGRLGELTNGDIAKTPVSPVSSNGDHPASPVFSDKMNGVAKTPSPSNSVSSSPGKTTPAGRRFSNPPPGRGVNMQRFISSKGKDVAFKSFNGSGLEKSSSLVALNHEPYELKPPQIPVQNKVSQRRSVTMAGPRIQEELKEMQEREEELKKQRARMLGLSQPNLSVVGKDEEEEVKNGHEENPSLDRSTSNPNLTENSESHQNEQSDEKNAPVGVARRRSTLIEQWEQRIQKMDVKS